MKFKLFTISLLLFSMVIFANNITISNVSLSNKSTLQESTYHLNFDVAWENSWRTSTNESNYDGAWVFFKFRLSNTSEWKHLTLIQPDNSSPAIGATIQIPNDGAGLFIYRTANGIGNVNYTNNYVIWDFQNDGVLESQTVEIKAFAIEMVYIPQGPYYLGSGGFDLFCFKNGETSNPYYVAQNTITINNTGNNLYQSVPIGQVDLPANGTILNSSFPKGYNAFWLMKYEASQQQFVDFLNNLNAFQAQNLLTKISPNNCTTGSYPNIQAVFPDAPVYNTYGYLLLSMADWCGLRPYTELEYEKACRGAGITPTPNEYAWGTTNYVALLTVNNAGTNTESVNTPANANANYDAENVNRVGIFARNTGATRELTGATYYGVMNMNDNAKEYCIHITAHNTFSQSEFGNGTLSNNGQTDITNWSNSLFTPRGRTLSTRGYSYISNNPPNGGELIKIGIRLAR